MPGRLHAGLLGGGRLILARVSQPGPDDQRVLLCGGPSWVLWGLAQPPWPHPLNARSSPSVMTTDVPDTAQYPGVQSRLGRASCEVTASLPSPCPASPTTHTVNSVSIWIKHIRVGGRGRGLMLGSGLRRKQGQKDTMTQRCREGEAGCALPTGSTGSSLGSWVLPSPSRKTPKCRSTPDKETRTVPRCRISWKGSLVRSASPPSWCPSHIHIVLSVKPRGGTPLGQQTLINAPPTLLCNFDLFPE